MTAERSNLFYSVRGIVFLLACMSLCGCRAGSDDSATTTTNNQLAQQVYVKALDAAESDQFGYHIALSGDTLVVGAANKNSRAGAVYVFVRDSAGVWSQQACLVSPSPGSGSFGCSVALSGNTLAVGANDENSSTGAVYVFSRSGSTWSLQARLQPSNPGALDGFGWSVALDGDTLAVGAIYEDSLATGVDGNQADGPAGNNTNSGAVYVFNRSGATWSQQAYVKASNTDAGDYFGFSVALDGDTLAVGAIYESSSAKGVGGDQTNNAATYSGAVYVFSRSGAVWSQQAYVKASNTESGDGFGGSLALDGDTLAVGARGEDSLATGVDGSQANGPAGLSINSGAVYVFNRSGAVWSQQAYIKASNAEAGDQFGESLTLSGDTLAIGASYEDSSAAGVDGDQVNNDAANSGATYVFRRSGVIWAQQAYVKASNVDPGDYFSSSLALDGGTLAVGARCEDSSAVGVGGNQADNGATNSGAVYLFR